MVWFSYHGGHSGEFCGHAKGQLSAVVQAALERGFTTYGLSEHAPRYELQHLYPEEAGLTPVDVGPVVWTRLHIIPFIGGEWDGQRELYHLVRTPAFTPRPALSWEQLNSEYVFGLRWWTTAELAEAEETFAPRRLPELLRSLLRDGPPAEPIDAGV